MKRFLYVKDYMLSSTSLERIGWEKKIQQDN